MLRFFKGFAQKVNKKNFHDSDKLESIGKKLEAYASFFEPLSLIPEPTVSILGKASSYFLKWGGKTAKQMGEAYKQDLPSTKSDIEKHLKKLNKKIVIIIDDIDRLNNTEIKQIFQLIKSLGSFPNTIYLSSMDKDVVVNALSEVQHGNGNEYLEKIINVPLEIPQLSNSDVQKFLFKKLDEIIKDIAEEDFDQNYWGNVFHSGYKNFFSNIRDVIRYMNILKFNHDALRNKVNIIDLMVITAFQVFEPAIYEFIKTNKNILSGQESDGGHSSSYDRKRDNQNKLKEELENSKKLLQRIDSESFIDLLQEIFIKVSEIYSNTHYVGALARHRKDSKIASQEFFDTYFTLTLTEELSNYEMKNIINKTSNEDEFSKIILELIENGKITTFLQRFQDFTKEDIPKENFQTIFNVLINLGDEVPENKNGMYSFGNSMEIIRIFYQLYSQLENEIEVYNLLKEAIEKSQTSIYVACREIGILMQKYGEYESIEEKDDKFITNEQLQSLKKLIIVKINKWTENNLLFEHESALSIMYLWKKIDEKNCLNYISNNTNSKKNLLKFLQVFIHHSYSHTMGDYTEKKTTKFNYKGIKDFVDVKLITSHIEKISHELKEEEKFVVENFIGYHEGKIIDDDY